MGLENEPKRREENRPGEKQTRPITRKAFSLGRIVITPGAAEAIPQPEVLSALTRHAGGDWGLVGQDDWQENDLSVDEGFRVLSAYEATGGIRFWIITEADRASTCILLPREY
jgi:hypothetical protein